MDVLSYVGLHFLSKQAGTIYMKTLSNLNKGNIYTDIRYLALKGTIIHELPIRVVIKWTYPYNHSFNDD